MNLLKSTLASLGAMATSTFVFLRLHEYVDAATCSHPTAAEGFCYDLGVRPLLLAYEHLSVVLVCLAVGWVARRTGASSRAVFLLAAYILGLALAGFLALLAGRPDIFITAAVFGGFLGVYLRKKHVPYAPNNSLQGRRP